MVRAPPHSLHSAYAVANAPFEIFDLVSDPSTQNQSSSGLLRGALFARDDGRAERCGLGGPVRLVRCTLVR